MPTRTVAVPFFVLIPLLFNVVLSFRTKVQQQTNGFEVEHEHTEKHTSGLEVFHEHSGLTQWPVSNDDRHILGEILKILNPPGAEIKWTWANEVNSWTFGLVTLTAQSARGALALHMLHRHGLGPLLASRGGDRFMSGFREKLKSKKAVTDFDKANALVEAQEEYDEVQKLRALLEQLSLNGLRNLHSWDHAWSVRTGRGKVSGCSDESPANCVLQAGYSPLAYNFLRQNGFSSSGTSHVNTAKMKVLIAVFNPLGYWNLASSTRKALGTPRNTGKIIVRDWETKGSSDWLKALAIGSKSVSAEVVWEDGASANLSIPIDGDMHEKLKGADEETKKVKLVTELAELYISEKLADHKTYMFKHRLAIWAGEEGEFVEMYEHLPK